jgi:YidC/Oxa1 family membrane protein insertase
MAVFIGWIAWQQQIQLEKREREAAVAESLESPETIEEPVRQPTSWNDGKTQPATSQVEQGDKGEQVLKSAELAPAPSAVAPWSGVLENDVVRVEFTNRGAVIQSLAMKDYFETPRHEIPVELIDVPESLVGTLGTAFLASGDTDLSESLYQVERATSSEIILLLRRGDLEVRKTFSHPDESYEMDFVVELTNRGQTPIDSAYSISLPTAVNQRTDFSELGLIALVGEEVTRELVPTLGSGGFFGSLFGEDEGPFKASSDVIWAGIDLRYFAGLIIPADPTDVGVAFVPIVEGKSATAEVRQRGSRLLPGESISRRYSVFFGPKNPPLLRELGRDLDLTLNRGWSWVEPLTLFFEWALEKVHRVIPNYGLAIIVLTILVRLVTLPIVTKQMKSAERMREVMPRIKVLQEKYKDDRQKQSEETFKIYREEGVNPLSGCFPLLLQMPVFIGLFYALQTSFDLRQAPFVFWINDLSTPATLFTLPGLDFPVRILPFLMAGSMVFQQQMTPQTGMDPAQAKMMMIMMPGIMLLFSYTFPSGLVLYWTVSNLLGIGHQLLIRRRMHAKSEAAG